MFGETRADLLPAYTKADVALYLRLPASTVAAWTRGMSYRDRNGEKGFFYPVIIPADRIYLSFQNLVELYVLKSIRRDHDVPMNRVRRAIAELRRRSGSEHPLADFDLLTDGRDIIIQELGELFNVNLYGQREMGELLDRVLRRIGVENGELQYRPVESVVFSPSRQFGRPCIAGTRIPTDVIYVRNKNGESIEELSDDLDCDATLLQGAISYEHELRAA